MNDDVRRRPGAQEPLREQVDQPRGRDLAGVREDRGVRDHRRMRHPVDQHGDRREEPGDRPRGAEFHQRVPVGRGGPGHDHRAERPDPDAREGWHRNEERQARVDPPPDRDQLVAHLVAHQDAHERERERDPSPEGRQARDVPDGRVEVARKKRGEEGSEKERAGQGPLVRGGRRLGGEEEDGPPPAASQKRKHTEDIEVAPQAQKPRLRISAGIDLEHGAAVLDLDPAHRKRHLDRRPDRSKPLRGQGRHGF